MFILFLFHLMNISGFILYMYIYSPLSLVFMTAWFILYAFVSCHFLIGWIVSQFKILKRFLTVLYLFLLVILRTNRCLFPLRNIIINTQHNINMRVKRSNAN